MNIRPIRTEGDYREALATVDSLWSNAIPGAPEGDQLDILITLVQAYEAVHYPIAAPDPIEAIKFRLEQGGLSTKDLQPMIGRPNRVYEVLTKKRNLTLQMIRRLHHGLGIPPAALIAEYA